MFESSSKIKVLSSGYLILAVVLFIWPALYNNYPLATQDTGAYVQNGMRLSLPMIDRPFGYILFIMVTSLGSTMWGIVVAQGLIAALMVRRLLKLLLGSFYTDPLFLGIVMLTAVFTSASWFLSQVMPDAFSGLFVIILILLYLERNNNQFRNLYFFCLAMICLMHYSHLLILFLLLVSALFYYKGFENSTKKIYKYTAILSISCYLLICVLNVVKFNKFSLSPASHVFMMARFAENGILDKYLSENCPQRNLDLCKYKDQLGERQWDFMWNSNVPFPHNRENGWFESAGEYRIIIRDIFTTPRYLGLILIKWVEGTLRQLCQIQVGDGLEQLGQDSAPYKAVESRIPHELKEYRNSRQVSGQLPFHAVSWTILIGSLLSFSSALFARKLPEKANFWNNLICVVILLVFYNAFIASTFSTVIGRLQSRIFWVLPLISIVYFILSIKGHKPSDGLNVET